MEYLGREISTEKKDKLQPKSECIVELTGIVCRKTCSFITKELLKYVLFQRDQIPMTFDKLVATEKSKAQPQTQSFSSSSCGTGNGLSHATSSIGISSESRDAGVFQCKQMEAIDNGKDYCLKPLKLRQLNEDGNGMKTHSLSSRRRSQAVEFCLTMIRHLEVAFGDSVFPIKQVAIILGSSLVTAKETFLLSFPANRLEGKNVPQDVVKKKFFRELVTSDFIESFSQTSAKYGLTKTYLLVYTNRNSELQWFRPNPRFTIPTKGTVYNINLTNPEAVNTSLYISSSDDSLLELSGISPMEVTISEFSSPGNTPLAKRRRINHSFEEVCDLNDDIWYQAASPIKGFK